MSDLTRLDAATLGAKIAAKEVSSTEVTQACLDQIAATDGAYHAFLHVGGDQALAAAAAVDAQIAAGESPASPLAGVPLAILVGISYALWAGLCVAFIAFEARPTIEVGRRR